MPRVIRITPEQAAIWLSPVPGDKRFWCRNGQDYNTMEELRAGLEQMDDQAYAYHTDGRNDFSRWVQDVMGDETLARWLATSSGHLEAAQAVAQRVAFLSQRAGR